MTRSRHADLTPLLGPAALGLLTSAEQERLDRHLRLCPACREELAALTAVAGRLGDLDAESALAAASPALADTALLRISRERRRASRLQAVVAAAAAVAVLMAGLLAAGSVGSDADPAVPLEAVAVRADEGVSARADLVAHTWGVEIKLVATGLADGQAYAATVTTETGEVVDAGAFLGTGGRTLSCNLNTAVLREDARSFTVVDASGREVLTAQL